MSEQDRLLVSAIDQEMRMAQGTDTSKLSRQRTEAMERYYGEPYGNEKPDRSDVRTREVMDTIEWIKPELMKLFSGGGDTVRFEPQGPEDVKQAQQETDYVNFVLHRKNPGFSIIYNWITDGLLQKNGVVKSYYDDTPRDRREEYKGITEQEMITLVAPENIEIIDLQEYDDPVEKEKRAIAAANLQKQYDQAIQAAPQRLRQMQATVQGLAGAQQEQAMQQLLMAQQQVQQRLDQLKSQIDELQLGPVTKVYDLVLRVTEEGRGIVIENIPPEEFFISAGAKSIRDARFCAHEREMSSSDLIEMGFPRELVETLPSGGSETYIREEYRARHQYDDTDEFGRDAFTAGPNKMHWVQEAYIHYDYDDDGIAELRRVLKVGNEVLENDEVSCMPFCAWTPIMIPHKFFGLSMADIVVDLQKIKTQLFRNILDNQYLANNGRYEVVENMVNYEDLMESRTHGIVRVKAPGSVKRLDTPQLSGTAFQMLQYVDYMRERRTGVSERTQGLDENALGPHTAASAVNQVMTAAQQRIELIARVFAETGLCDLFRLIHRLVVMNATRPEIFRLRDDYIEANPRTWRHRTDTSVVVGLGNGSRESEMMQLNLMLQNQMALSNNPAFQGIVMPGNVYNLLEDQVKVFNKAASGRYFTDPNTDEQQMIMSLQQQVQQLTMQMQQQAQEFQTSLQSRAIAIEEFKAQAKAQTEQQNTEIKQQAQELDEQEHEDDVALRTAELGLEAEQKRGVSIG